MLQYSGSRKPSPIPFRPVYFPSAPKHHKQQHTIDQFGPLQTKSQRLPSIEGVCPFFHENTSLSCDDKTNGTKESIRKFLGKLSGFTFLKKKICDWSSTKRTEASTRPLNNPPNAKVLKIDTPNLEVKPRKVEPKPPQSQTVYSITEEKNIVKRAVQYLDSQAQLHFVQKLLDIALVAQPNYQYFITPDPSAPTRSAVRVGQRYDFHHILGAGSFSEVRLAKDLNNDERLVAIKLVKASKLRQNCRLMETMAREVAILAKVRHTNIVKYEDIFVVRDYICIVMEYVDGGELFNVILNLGGGGMKEVAAKVVLKQILSGIHQEFNRTV